MDNVGTLGGEDGKHPIFSAELKKCKAFRGNAFMEQAIRNCPNEKVPMVVVHTTGRNHNDDLVIIRLRDFEDLYGRVPIVREVLCDKSGSDQATSENVGVAGQEFSANQV